MSAIRLPRIRPALRPERWPRPLGVLAGLLAALACGALVARGSAVLVLLATGGAAFALWAISRPEQATLGVLVLTPFSIYPATVGGFSIFLLVPLAGFTSLVLALRRHGNLQLLRRRLPVGVFAFVVLIAGATAGVSSDPTTAYSRLLYLVVFGIFAGALAATLRTGRLTTRKVAQALVFGAALAGVALIVQVLAQFSVGSGAVLDWLNQVTGSFAGAHSAAETGQLNWTIEGLNIVRGIFPFMSAPSAGQYMMLGLVAAVWLRRTAPPTPGMASALEWAAIAIIATALLLTFSRQAWIGAFAGLGALALRKRPVWMFAVILLLFVVMTAISAPGGHGSFADYLLTASDKTTASSGTRVDLWRQALQLVPHHWALGVGPGLYATLNPDPVNPIYYAHNAFLDGLVELGVAGGVALIALFAASMTSAFRRSATLGFGLLAAWVTANLFDDVLYFPRNGVILAAAFALAAAGDSPEARRPAMRPRQASR